MRKILYAILLLCALATCKPAGEKPLPIPVMKTVMWDMMLADEWYGLVRIKDSVGKFRNDNFRMYEKVFSIHGIKKESFYNSYKYYEAHPEQMKILIDSVEQFSSRERARMEEIRNKPNKKS